MGKVLKSNNTAKNPHETRENNESTLQTKMHRVAVQVASSGIGQTLMMQFGKLLWTLEKTAIWISNGKTGKRTKIIKFLFFLFFFSVQILDAPKQ